MRQRNRHLLFQELQDLVLRHTQVRVRPDGEVAQESDRIGFRISPDLERHERCSYLMSRLAPRPRKVRPSAEGQKETATLSPPLRILKRDGQLDATPTSSSTPTATPMEGVEEAEPPSRAKDDVTPGVVPDAAPEG